MKIYYLFAMICSLIIQELDSDLSKYFFLLEIPMIFIYLILSYNKKKVNFLLLLFFISNIVFLYGKVYLTILREQKLIGMFFAPYCFGSETYINIIKILNYNILGIFLGIFLGEIYLKKIKRKKSEKKDVKIINFIFFIILITSIISIFLSYKYSKIVNLHGYLSSFNGVADKVFGELNSKLSFVFINTFTYLLFIWLSLFEDIKNKKLYIVLIILFIVKFTENLSGGRGKTISCIFFILWYVYFLLNKKIDLKKLIIIGILSVSLCFFLASKRNIKEKLYFKISGITKIVEFLDEQGGSISLLGYYIDNEEKLHILERPMIFSFLLGGPEKIISKITNQKYEYKTSFYLGERMSFIMNRDYFEKGAGTGGNYIVEMYDFGGRVGVVILTAILIFFLYYIQINFLYMNVFKRSYVLYFIYSVFLLPRTHYLAIGITGSLILLFYNLFLIYMKNKK